MRPRVVKWLIMQRRNSGERRDEGVFLFETNGTQVTFNTKTERADLVWMFVKEFREPVIENIFASWLVIIIFIHHNMIAKKQ